jgi:hypothetical protein
LQKKLSAVIVFIVPALTVNGNDETAAANGIVRLFDSKNIIAFELPTLRKKGLKVVILSLSISSLMRTKVRFLYFGFGIRGSVIVHTRARSRRVTGRFIDTGTTLVDERDDAHTFGAKRLYE